MNLRSDLQELESRGEMTMDRIELAQMHAALGQAEFYLNLDCYMCIV